jgi:REP element-mobilizing transposase RayT
MNVRNGFKPFPTGKTMHGLPEIISGLKTFSSRRINEINNDIQWQKSYYDHVIRNDKSLLSFRTYIQNNPRKWELDQDYREANDILKLSAM